MSKMVAIVAVPTRGAKKVGRGPARGADQDRSQRLNLQEHVGICEAIRSHATQSEWAAAVGKLDADLTVMASDIESWVRNKIRRSPNMKFEDARRFYVAGLRISSARAFGWQTRIAKAAPSVTRYHYGYGIEGRSIGARYEKPFLPVMLSRGQIALLADEIAARQGRDRQGSRRQRTAEIEAYLEEHHSDWTSGTVYFITQLVTAILFRSYNRGRLGPKTDDTHSEIGRIQYALETILREVLTADEVGSDPFNSPFSRALKNARGD